VGRELGVRDEQLADLASYRTSPHFSEVERLVVELAEHMTQVRVDVPADLLEGLRRHFDDAQMVELSSYIAWENYRARFNRVFGVEAVGFSEGAFCALPEEPRSLS
jgi:alkylhydroperoxidase family enzyme